MRLVGEIVVARARVEEEGFQGPGMYVHAERGEVGEVVDVFDAGWSMVRWARTGTACQCHEDELMGPAAFPILVSARAKA